MLATLVTRVTRDSTPLVPRLSAILQRHIFDYDKTSENQMGPLSIESSHWVGKPHDSLSGWFAELADHTCLVDPVDSTRCSLPETQPEPHHRPSGYPPFPSFDTLPPS